MKIETEIERIKLRKLNNTRDIGGVRTEDGRKIKEGMLYRSGRLYKLPKKTVECLKDLDIRTVIDLRMQPETIEKPDSLPEGCRVVNCPLVCTATPGITYQPKIRTTLKIESKSIVGKYEDGDEYMSQMYINMITSSDSIVALKKFFSVLLETEEGAILFHCASGKDRVGICAMLIESALGVQEKDILNDYIITRRFCSRKFFWNRVGLVILPVTFRFKKVLYCMMRTKKEYIKAVIDYAKEHYGSVLDYIKTELGLTDEDIGKLRNKYLTESPV